jgi:putative hydroxymethylpyrimidine transport system substrate-binding protein
MPGHRDGNVSDVRRARGVLGLFSAVALLAAACGGGGDAPSEAPGEAPQESAAAACSGPSDIEQPSVTFMADWLPWAVSGPMWAAKENGYYEEEGLEVKIVAPAENADPQKIVAAGRAQFAISDVPVVMQAIDQGVPLISIGAPLRHLAFGLIFNPDSGISGPADLEGKVLGVNPGPEADAYLETMLASAGLTRDDVTVVDPGFAATKLVLNGKVAAASAFTFYEGSLYKLETGEDPGFLLWTEYGVPDFYHQILIANSEWAASNPCTTKAFLAATIRGLEDFLTDPDAVTPLLAEQNEVVPLDAQNQMAADVEYDWTDEVTDEHGFFYQTLDRWEEAQQWVLDAGLIENPVDPSTYFTNEYLPSE